MQASSLREPIVPTLDVEVRSALRAAGAPIQLFAEGAPQRRGRLRLIMSTQQWQDVGALYRACGVQVSAAAAAAPRGAAAVPPKEQFSRGPVELVDLRRHILQTSIARSQARLQQQKLDNIKFQQEGAEKLRGKLQALAKTHLANLARRLTVMNVGIERVGCSDDNEHHPIRVGLTTVAALPQNDNTSTTTIATGDAAGVVTVWNAHTGRPQVSHHLHALGYGRVNSIVASTARHGLFFACARNKPSVSLLRITDDEAQSSQVEMTELTSSTVPHRGVFHRLAADPTGTLVAATSNDCLVRVWDARGLSEGATAPTFAFALDGLVEGRRALGVAFHPDGSLLSVTDAAGRCTTWDQRSGRCVFSTWHVPHTCSVASTVAWSPNGVQFATAGTDHAIHVWDARALATSQRESLTDSKQLPQLTIVPHFDVVTSLSFVPLRAADGFTGAASTNGPILCSTSLDGTVQFHDVWCTGRTLHSVATNFAEGGVRAHCWSTTPSGARQLVAVTSARHWTSWSTDVDGVEGVIVNDVTVAKAAQPTRAPAPTPQGVADVAGDEDDDEDEMQSLRKPTAPLAVAPPQSTSVAEDEDDDDDDMAALRRK